MANQQPEAWALRKRIYQGRQYYHEGILYEALRPVDNGATTPPQKAPAGFYKVVGSWPVGATTAPVAPAPPIVVAPAPTMPAPAGSTLADVQAENQRLSTENIRLAQALNLSQQQVADLTQQVLSLQDKVAPRPQPLPVVLSPVVPTAAGAITFTPSEAPTAKLEAKPI